MAEAMGYITSRCVVPSGSCIERRAGDKPRALDLFCGAGGATKGLQMAGFHVTGVDIKPQPRYCGDEFHQADALTFPVEGFDFIWASPPCQRYTMAQNAAKNALSHPDLIPPIRERLKAAGVPYVIENVVGAPLELPILLCGLALGLKVKRHRLFESPQLLLAPPCPSHDKDYYVIFGHECRNRRHGIAAGRKNRIDVGREAMGIDWMTRGELSESIPPAYSEFIGRQVMEYFRPDATPPNSVCNGIEPLDSGGAFPKQA